MSYLIQAPDSRRRQIAIVGVAAVHALLVYGLINGLSFVHLIEPAQNFEGRQIDDFPLPPPPPDPQPPRETDDRLPTPVPPLPPTPFPPDPLPPTDTSDERPPSFPDDGRGGDDTAAPRDPPLPFFTPRGARPSNGPQGWLTNADYPVGTEAEGIAAYRLIVGTGGRVSSCDVTRSTGNRRLDDATCRLLIRRARFEAATDETGAKVIGSYTGTVKWEIPD